MGTTNIDVTDKCIAWWKLDDIGGSDDLILDEIGTYNGTNVGGTLTTGIDGEAESALALATDQYFTVATDADASSSGLDFVDGKFCLAFWTKLTAEEGHQAFISRKGIATPGNGCPWAFYYEAETNRLHMFISRPYPSNPSVFENSSLMLELTSPLNDGEWHFIVANYDMNITSENLKISIDNEAYSALDDQNYTIGPLGIVDDPMIVGNLNTDASFDLTGALDNFMIFEDLLTDDEKTYLYNDGSGVNSLSGSFTDDDDDDTLPTITNVSNVLILNAPVLRITGTQIINGTKTSISSKQFTNNKSISSSGVYQNLAREDDIYTFYGPITISLTTNYPLKDYSFLTAHPNRFVGNLRDSANINKAEIRYTYNGKLPTPTSKLYTGSFTLRKDITSDNTVLRVAVFYKGKKSEILNVTFRIINP